MFTAALSATPANNQASLRDSMNDLRSQWNLLNNELNSVKLHLNASQNRWEDFESSLETLVRWVKNMTENVDKEYDHKAELSDMRTLLEK